MLTVVILFSSDMPKETLNCFDADSSCECSNETKVCIFNLEIDEIRTFTSYQKLAVNETTGIVMRGVQGVSYYFNDSGAALPLQPDRECSTLESTNCTDPQFVDGKTYRLAIAVNGQIPGPTLIVHEEQIVVIHVHNNLTTEGISIHWHGMHQRGTPFFDGVGQVTQCQIGPSSTFSYMYLARPPGTFWYHSHSGAQRTDGFYGALIVKESPGRMEEIKGRLQSDLRLFEDFPEDHTISLLDWQEEPGLDLLSKVQGGVGFYPDTLPGEVPTPDDEKYVSTVSADGAGVGPIPYFSGLINGKGRHVDIPYNKTRLSVFTVEAEKTYRFRLIGAQGLYAYRFSIDGHKLTVVGTDGYWIEPVEEVDYIIIHSGERYDFLLHAIKDCGDFWIRAETLEVDQTNGHVPYESLDHVAEAILHYREDGDSGDSDIDVPSTEYATIKFQSPHRDCTADRPCKAVNCPFLNFHSSYNINCSNVDSLLLLLPTPPEELPDANPEEDCENCTFFINFSFEGDSDTSSVNGRNFILPSSPPQIQPKKFYEDDTICNLTTNCNPFTPACSCAHVIDIPQNKTIQMVFSAIGIRHNAHPIHLHGHTFHVVHVGYPEYHQTTGFITEHTSDINCDDENCKNEGCNQERCTRPSWEDPERMKFPINNHTIRKDTVMLPAGGYVVINFLSDNPGWWFLHCHIEIHQLQGMALIVNEASDDSPDAPEEMKQCGNFEIPIEDFISDSANIHH